MWWLVACNWFNLHECWWLALCKHNFSFQCVLLFSLRLSASLCLCLYLWNANAVWNTCAYAQREQHRSLLSGVAGSLLLPATTLLVFSNNPFKIYCCGSGCPAPLRTVGAQCEHHRTSDDILPASQTPTVPETSTSSCAEIDGSFLRSLHALPFLFLYLFDIWLAGSDGGKPPFRVGHFGLWLV